MKRTLYTLAGLVLGYIAVAVAGIGLASVAPISQAEGAYMMGVFFFWGPIGALIGAVTGNWLGRAR